MHQALGWSLVLFLGCTPLASLLALTNEPACQMACCDRKHHSGSCPRHQTVTQGAASIHFEASNDCSPNCSCTGIAPSASDHALVLPWTRIWVTNGQSCETQIVPSPSIHGAIDPSLYQRP